MNGNYFYFAPQLFIPHATRDIDFYKKAFDAVELRRITNDDGTVHVAEFYINGALLHLHEENHSKGHFAPTKETGISSIVGLFVNDVEAAMKKAIDAGAELVQPATDFDYGYRQGEVRDPFGHLWLIQLEI